MIETIEFSAVVASAIFGVLLAARKEMDAVGIITVALAVAFGGGTLCDLFLDRTPLFPPFRRQQFLDQPMLFTFQGQTIGRRASSVSDRPQRRNAAVSPDHSRLCSHVRQNAGRSPTVTATFWRT
jgi:hypothetical protein